MDTDDPDYKAKRKALSAAFLKSKMSEIIEITKESAFVSFAELQQKGAETEIELVSTVSKVQAHIITSILVGVKYSFMKIPHTDLDTGKVTQKTLGDYMDAIIEDQMSRLTKNPLLKINPAKFAEKEIFAVDTRFFSNVRELRAFIKKIIEAKKEQKDGNAADIVSLLLQDSSYQNEEDIIDDMLLMFIAGSKTIMSVTINYICSMLHYPEEEKRLRVEVEDLFKRIGSDVVGKLNQEAVEDLEYVKNSYNESLRLNSAAAISQISQMTRDVTIGGAEVRKDDAFIVDITHLQRDPK